MRPAEFLLRYPGVTVSLDLSTERKDLLADADVAKCTKAAALAGLCLAQTQSSARPNEDVDLALVITTDVSYSVDENEARFQRQGAVAAFRNPEVVKAIQSGARGRIAVAYIDFATTGTNKVIAGWHVVHDKASAGAFADILEAAPRNDSKR